MTVLESEMIDRKSRTITNTSTNGGPMGTTTVVDGANNNVFPRVTEDERVAGIVRYRKTFVHNVNPDNDPANGVLASFGLPSSSEDRLYIGMGTGSDTQGDVEASDEYPHWNGTGQLASGILAGATTIDIVMESNDFEIMPGGVLFISDAFMVAQPMATEPANAIPRIGDSVEFVGGEWVRRTFVGNTAYPYGWYYGNGVVITSGATSSTEHPRVVEGKTESEVLGTGDGGTTPTVSDFAGVTNGLNFKGVYVDGRETGWTPMKPRLDITVSATPTTLWFDADGFLTGATAGRINMLTGEWIVPPTFIGAPDSGTEITTTYWDKPYSFSGNTMTVQLQDPVAEDYAAANTFAGGCVETGELIAISRNWTLSSVSGTYDSTTYPVAVGNVGTVYDFWTLQLTTATAFSCSGVFSGDTGTGSTTQDFSPVNPATGQPYFTINLLGWGGTLAIGDTVTFITEPSAAPWWFKEVVPAGANNVKKNFTSVTKYWE